jgi:dipeptidyl-peptidase-4
MKNGENYLVIEPTGIAKYSYKTSQKEGNLVDGSLKAMNFLMMNLKFFTERKSTDLQTFFLGKFEVKDLKSGKVQS